MAEIIINNVVKLILGILILVIILTGLFFAFRFYIIPYFKGLPGNEIAEIFLTLIGK